MTGPGPLTRTGSRFSEVAQPGEPRLFRFDWITWITWKSRTGLGRAAACGRLVFLFLQARGIRSVIVPSGCLRWGGRPICM